MDLMMSLTAERQKRKDITKANDKVRQQLIREIKTEAAEDDRWQVRLDRNGEMFVANCSVDVLYRTQRQCEDKSALLHFRLVVRDGGIVDIKNARGGALATGDGAEEALGHVARLVAEFEWPDDASRENGLRLDLS